MHLAVNAGSTECIDVMRASVNEGAWRSYLQGDFDTEDDYCCVRLAVENGHAEVIRALLRDLSPEFVERKILLRDHWSNPRWPSQEFPMLGSFEHAIALDRHDMVDALLATLPERAVEEINFPHSGGDRAQMRSCVNVFNALRKKLPDRESARIAFWGPARAGNFAAFKGLLHFFDGKSKQLVNEEPKCAEAVFDMHVRWGEKDALNLIVPASFGNISDYFNQNPCVLARSVEAAALEGNWRSLNMLYGFLKEKLSEYFDENPEVFARAIEVAAQKGHALVLLRLAQIIRRRFRNYFEVHPQVVTRAVEAAIRGGNENLLNEFKWFLGRSLKDYVLVSLDSAARASERVELHGNADMLIAWSNAVGKKLENYLKERPEAFDRLASVVERDYPGSSVTDLKAAAEAKMMAVISKLDENLGISSSDKIWAYQGVLFSRALEAAAGAGHASVIKVLLASVTKVLLEYDAHQSEIIRELSDLDSVLASALRKAAAGGHAAVIAELKKCLGSGFWSDLDAVSEIFLLAAKSGHSLVITELLQGLDSGTFGRLFGEPPSYGNTIVKLDVPVGSNVSGFKLYPRMQDALMAAARNGHHAAVESLLGEHGSVTELAFLEDAQFVGMALLEAAKGGHEKVIKALLGRSRMSFLFDSLLETKEYAEALSVGISKFHTGVIAALLKTSNTKVEDLRPISMLEISLSSAIKGVASRKAVIDSLRAAVLKKDEKVVGFVLNAFSDEAKARELIDAVLQQGQAEDVSSKKLWMASVGGQAGMVKECLDSLTLDKIYEALTDNRSTGVNINHLMTSRSVEVLKAVFSAVKASDLLEIDHDFNVLIAQGVIELLGYESLSFAIAQSKLKELLNWLPSHQILYAFFHGSGLCYWDMDEFSTQWPHADGDDALPRAVLFDFMRELLNRVDPLVVYDQRSWVLDKFSAIGDVAGLNVIFGSLPQNKADEYISKLVFEKNSKFLQELKECSDDLKAHEKSTLLSAVIGWASDALAETMHEALRDVELGVVAQLPRPGAAGPAGNVAAASDSQSIH